MTTEQLYEKIDKRFEQIDKRFEQIDKRFEQIDKRFEQMDKKFEQMDKRFDKLEFEMKQGFKEVNKRLQIIEDKLDNTTNSNIAQILSNQTKFQKESNKKSTYNELEHKKFDCRITELELQKRYTG